MIEWRLESALYVFVLKHLNIYTHTTLRIVCTVSTSTMQTMLMVAHFAALFLTMFTQDYNHNEYHGRADPHL